MKITLGNLKELIREALDPSHYDHITDKDKKKQDQSSPRPGETLTMKSLGGGKVGGSGSAKVSGWENVDESDDMMNEFDSVSERPELGKAIEQLVTVMKKAPPGDKGVRELEGMINQLVSKYKDLSSTSTARKGPGGKVAPKPPRPWELH